MRSFSRLLNPNDLRGRRGAPTTLDSIDTTSGTAHDFTNIPLYVSKISLLLFGVSTDSTGNLLVQLGDSGGIETTGYESTAMRMGTSPTIAGTSSTAGFIVMSTDAASTISGIVHIQKISSIDGGLSWVSNHSTKVDTSFAGCGGGHKALSSSLTQVRLTLTSGNFDAGTINLIYE